jgi:hypothetical protein
MVRDRAGEIVNVNIELLGPKSNKGVNSGVAFRPEDCRFCIESQSGRSRESLGTCENIVKDVFLDFGSLECQNIWRAAFLKFKACR